MLWWLERMDWKFLAQCLDLGRHPMGLNSYYPTDDKKHSTLSLHFTNGLSFPLKNHSDSCSEAWNLLQLLHSWTNCSLHQHISLHITVSVICTVSMKTSQQITVMNCRLFLGSIHLLTQKKKLTWSYSFPFMSRSHLEAEFYYMCFYPGIILNYLCAGTTLGFSDSVATQEGVHL